eukprot:1348881-Heterocapsa_arctica.AAC.1
MPPEREKSQPVLSAPWEFAGKARVRHLTTFEQFIWSNRFRVSIGYLFEQGMSTRVYLARQQRSTQPHSRAFDWISARTDTNR